ncbi:MAG TPA: hydantoinase/oxoprolinase family protein, partial [Hyphomicrobiaceae bacterium]|nr:hydantoinase/oxoprolinase family protein [Hyphomicrobiaceae bacterium]
GALTGLITTRGFRDVLEIGRERKYELYDLGIQKPAPLVSRELRAEVTERIMVTGEILTPLDGAELVAAAQSLISSGAHSLAVVFLHSYANPVHERQAAEVLGREVGDVPLSCSVDVAPEIREYERTSTTVCNAYIKPLAERYLGAMAEKLLTAGISAQLLLMLSSGGLTGLNEAKRNPVQLLESGPAAGALAAAHLVGSDGGDHVLAFDMGGTTAKLSVIDDGQPHVGHSFEAARAKRFIEGSGLPIRITALELIEIGAGGGSIGRIDDIGLLKVGPESAGSEPGPACYGRGGSAATVTDANLLLGYLNPDYFAGGAIQVSPELAGEALVPLARETGHSSIELAWGIYEIVNESMANAARVHIAEHGKDPRSYRLLATGGGGPLHGYYVARKLGLTHMIVPRSAGVASALGLLIAPARTDRVATVASELKNIDWQGLEATFKRMTREAVEVLDETSPHARDAVITRSADMRYRGQAAEIVVELPAGPYTASDEATFLDAFKRTYETAFTRTPPATKIEIINVRVRATLPVGEGWRGAGVSAPAGTKPTPKAHRLAYFPETGVSDETPVYDRAGLPVGTELAGPLIIEEPESTLIVGPGGRLNVLANGNCLVEIG